MKLQDMIDATLKNSRPSGTFTLPVLLQFAKNGGVNGIAVSKENNKQQYLAILAGEAEGAIYIDDKGTLYGDNALMLITGDESFTLLDVNPELVEGLVAGSRIFEKSHLKKGKIYEIPEIGKKSGGIGVLTLTIQRDSVPQNGVRVTLRKDGKVVGSDITTNDGSVGFRIMHDKYDCIVQDRNQLITTFHIKFEESSPKIFLQL